MSSEKLLQDAERLREIARDLEHGITQALIGNRERARTEYENVLRNVLDYACTMRQRNASGGERWLAWHRVVERLRDLISEEEGTTWLTN